MSGVTSRGSGVDAEGGPEGDDECKRDRGTTEGRRGERSDGGRGLSPTSVYDLAFALDGAVGPGGKRLGRADRGTRRVAILCSTHCALRGF